MYCVVCGSRKNRIILNLNCGGFDNSPLYENLTIFSCKSCGHIYNYININQIEGLKKYYLDEYSQCNITSPNKTGDTPGNSSNDSLNRYNELYQIIKDNITVDTKLLDVGCAMGGFLKFISKYCDNLYGIDPSRRFVELAQDTPAIIIEGSAEHLPYQDKTFDVVLADQVVEHLTNPNRFFYEAKRIIKENGILCISVPDASKYYGNSFFDFYFFLMREHIQHFGPSQLERIAGNHGFKMLEYKTTYPNLISNIGRLPNLTMKFILTDEKIDNTIDNKNESIIEYIDDSYKQLIERRKFIEDIKDENISIYGVSREFFYLLKNTDLGKMNIRLFDDTKHKQTMKVNGNDILSSNFISDCNIKKIMITSFAHIEIMRKKLNKLNYRGEIL